MLRIEGLHHTYPAAEQPVLRLSDWALAAGEQVLLRGVSGSGKTTLLNIIAGLLRPSQGAIYYEAQAIYALGEAARDRLRARMVGYVFQNHYLLPTLTALENVAMPLAFGGVGTAMRKRRALALLEQVGLGSIARQYPAKISTGQRLRVAIARALANQPRLLLADEPTAALDEQSGCVVMDVMQAECRAHGAVLIVASHDPALETRFSTIVDLRGGTLSAYSRE
ncbi:MAG: ABC transporter ATP-binding protein [Chloroflexota bacterium]|nr:ABC transporter ATP-binding protein [Chloroflexota bacterium]